jgi:hypothetical protein
MGGIDDRHVEWAVVNRLKRMLDAPPRTRFNVTQSFALFNAILLWSKNRAWVAGKKEGRPAWFDAADHAAHDAREALRAASIFDAPWSLSKFAPRLERDDVSSPFDRPTERVNIDFEEMSAEQFIKWLRDALAHGDGRSIRPVHKQSRDGRKTFLAGFQITFEEERGSKRKLCLFLYHADMTRIGSILAHAFCSALSGGDRYFEQEIGTAKLVEAA